MAFKARLNAPSKSDKNWIHTSAGGKNSCIKVSGNSVLPNCVGYAWGRFMEILGKTPKLSRSNAENWYGYNDGYKRGKTPKLGAVIVWAKGKVGNSKDGAGHVAIVEEIYSDGSFLVSQSGYKSKRFWTSKIPKTGYLKGYTFLGFIYNPAVSSNTSTNASTNTSTVTFKVGKTYTLKANLKVRTGAGTNYRQKKRSELTASGKKSAQSGTYAVLKNGTKVTVQAVKNVGKKVWVKIPSGWICAKDGDSVYLR